MDMKEIIKRAENLDHSIINDANDISLLIRINEELAAGEASTSRKAIFDAVKQLSDSSINKYLFMYPTDREKLGKIYCYCAWFINRGYLQKQDEIILQDHLGKDGYSIFQQLIKICNKQIDLSYESIHPNEAWLTVIHLRNLKAPCAVKAGEIAINIIMSNYGEKDERVVKYLSAFAEICIEFNFIRKAIETLEKAISVYEEKDWLEFEKSIIALQLSALHIQEGQLEKARELYSVPAKLYGAVSLDVFELDGHPDPIKVMGDMEKSLEKLRFAMEQAGLKKERERLEEIIKSTRRKNLKHIVDNLDKWSEE